MSVGAIAARSAALSLLGVHGISAIWSIPIAISGATIAARDCVMSDSVSPAAMSSVDAALGMVFFVLISSPYAWIVSRPERKPILLILKPVKEVFPRIMFSPAASENPSSGTMQLAIQARLLRH